MKFGLLGQGIHYSMSPLIHTTIAKAALSYELYDIPPEKLDDTVKKDLSGLSGFNVTIPYKSSILKYCQEFDPIVQLLGAANTVHIQKGIWKAYNTDYLAFIKVMEECIADFLSFHPIIIGYGGVARAVLYGLQHLGFVSISLIGGKCAEERKAFLTEIRPNVGIKIFDQIPDMQKLWINCTPSGNIDHPEIPDYCQPMQSRDFLFDLNYKPQPTFMQEFAAQRGMRHINGLCMLLLQALEAQKIWLGPGKVMNKKEIENVLSKISL